jgi:hypothetical protein
VYYGHIIPQVTGIAEAGGMHALSSLSSYPNPFQDQTTISYTITATNEVELGVYDVYGKLLRTLVNEKQTAGTYNVVFAAGNIPEGFYYCRLNAGGETKTTGVVLIR